MNQFSFAQARSTNFSLAHQPASQNDSPFDPSLRFNRVVRPNEDDPSAVIYSIDPSSMLSRIEEDDLDALTSITLICKPARRGVSMWDTLFNTANRESISACVLAARHDYQPLGQERIVTAQPFLNFSMPVSRVHLNRVDVGDTVGVGIYDIAKQVTYVLLYRIESTCVVPMPSVRGKPLMSKEGRPAVTPGVNCTLDHIIRVHSDGEANMLDMSSVVYDEEKAKPFVEHIANAVYDIPVAFPFKPHFTPADTAGFERSKIENRIGRAIPTAKECRYEDFEAQCRQVYQNARETNTENHRSQNQGDRRAPASREKPLPRRNDVQKVSPPWIEVATLGDYFVVLFDGRSRAEYPVMKFHKNTIGKEAITETFLSNNDLHGVDLGECPKIMLLRKNEAFGDDGFVRYLQMNF